MKRMAYVLWGTTGEFSDRSEWVVAVYLDKERAEEHQRLAEKVVEGKQNLDWEEKDNLRSLFDPNVQVDYNGTRYYIVEVPLVVHVDEFLELHV